MYDMSLVKSTSGVATEGLPHPNGLQEAVPYPCIS